MITNNYPLRSGKGSLYEGGVRIPLIIRWPGLTKAGTISNEIVVLTDLYPTLDKALQSMPNGIDIKSLIPQAMHMGDESHNRNRAGEISALFPSSGRGIQIRLAQRPEIDRSRVG